MKKFRKTKDQLSKEIFSKVYPVTSDYGVRMLPRGRDFHNGVDFACPLGSRLSTIADGKVIISANYPAGYGQYVVLQCADFVVIYAHLSKRLAKVGDTVKKGEVIGLSGNTGVSSGPHLHFEMREGTYRDGFWVRDANGKYPGSFDPIGVSLSKYFDDIYKGWQVDAIDWCKEKGYLGGVSETSFAPDEPLTRAELAVVLKRILEEN